MTYTIAQNPAHNSLEITFDGKPGQAVREALKALRFRWHGVKKLWYGYADESAAHEAHVARTSEEYFFNENMREYRRTLEILNTGEHSYVRFMPCLINYYTGNSTYRTMKFLSVGDVLEALGGSGDLEAIKGTFIPGERFTSSGTPVYVCNDDDIARLRDGYQRAMNAHEKKVRAYLKRYGLSKVHAWTYWRDA